MNKNQIGWAVAAGFIVWFAACWAAQAQDVTCSAWQTTVTAGSTTQDRTCYAKDARGRVVVTEQFCAVKSTVTVCGLNYRDGRGRLIGTAMTENGKVVQVNGRRVS